MKISHLLPALLLLAACSATNSKPELSRARLAEALSAPQLENGLTDYVRQAGAPREGLRLEDLSWLEGRWEGEGLGGRCEESWQPAWGGMMIGTFRLMENSGAPNFYEFMTLLEDEEGIVLRLVHLSPELRPWEEPGETIDFRLIDVEGTTAWFGGLTLHREGERLAVHVAMSGQDGTTRDAHLAMWRTPLE